MSRRTKKQISFDQLLNDVSKLSKTELNKLVNNYLKVNGGKMTAKYNKAVLIDLEEHLKDLGVNSTCPKCGSKVIDKNGHRTSGTQKLICCDCGKSFTYFTGTILEKTKYHWDLWIEVIYMMLCNKSITDIQTTLIDDNHCAGLTASTVERWRYKILSACESVQQPVLSGVIQIDETHYHESQKGVKEADMEQVFPGLVRKSRPCYIPAKYGVMGSEFATVITAIDSTNHCVCKVSGLGKFDTKRFEELFSAHLKDVQWLCSDFNKVYSKYCDKNSIQHYVRPSDFVDTVAGKNDEELEKLYNDRKLDFIEHQRHSYKEMLSMRKTYGLNLGKVNELHGDLRKLLNTEHRGISTKHLNEWVAWFALLKNFAADYGHKPTSKKDAEIIFKMILKTKSNLLQENMYNRKINLPKPSDKELNNLKKKTDESRKLSGRKKFVFTAEDLIESGSVRKILNEMPLSKLKEICKYYANNTTGNKQNYRGYTTYLNNGKRFKYVQLLEKEPDIKEMILKIVGLTGKNIYTGDDNPNLPKSLSYLKNVVGLDIDDSDD